ncbi:metal dependent phosphohydrolase [Syntrophobotulus glycolicus DSM 8271]|uniref:Metal dependent phosphohydrolase n=1 Tax=Syntrophobotulus glycolicus (strain DSM 8271 / FlGlyR) TaxID=645991 RepID=F0T2U3_SYNGF|nr:HD domain-containing phosphohydrolase [Syntrophobotulus glycolicus]ADY57580.1 metal dependent phosphohydrolase [Syntrophobotulus glycolicus DSM 8271]
MSLNTAEKMIRRIWSFSRALDLALVDDEIKRGLKLNIGERHGERVGYISLRIGMMMGYKGKDLLLLLIAGLVHDIGAVGCFMDCHRDNHAMMKEHCELGAEIVRNFPGGDILETAIKFHHDIPALSEWSKIDPLSDPPVISQIISLADKVDLLMGRKNHTIADRQKLIGNVQERIDREFYSRPAQMFIRLAKEEAFWLDLLDGNLLDISLRRLLAGHGEFEVRLSDINDDLFGEEFVWELARTFAFLIDRKSAFTSLHSRRVADIVLALAQKMEFEQEKQEEIKIAGLLHDLGKLAIPTAILDKPESLEPEEIRIIKGHAYYTYKLLTAAGFPPNVVGWASYHHERLDGQGYPFCLDSSALDIGARLMTIADVFVALTEDRPYRKALTHKEAVKIMENGAGVIFDPLLLHAAQSILSVF